MEEQKKDGLKVPNSSQIKAVGFDAGKRRFLKKGILALMIGAAAAILSKTPFVRAERWHIKDYGEAVSVLGDLGGGTDDINLESGNVVTATVSTGEQTFTFSNPPASGTAGSFTLILTNGGSQTVNWPASVDWGRGNAPTLTASGVDVLCFITTDGGTTWLGFAAGLDVKSP